MKKRAIIVIGILAIAVVFALGLVDAHQHRQLMTPVEIECVPLPHEAVAPRHFYNALSDSERQVYSAVAELLSQHLWGEIVLDYPISARSYYRIETALLYDSERHWHFMALLPYNDSYELVFPPLVQRTPDATIYRLILAIGSEEFWRAAEEYFDPLMLEEVSDISDKERYYEVVYSISYFNEFYLDLSFYEAVNSQVETLIDGIIGDMPYGLNKEGAVMYFRQWITDNMIYDPVVYDFIRTGGTASPDVANRTRASGSIVSIIDGKGVCAGFSIIFDTLARRVGIDSYTVMGAGFGGRHTWNVVEIGGELYYFDPTYDIFLGRVRPLMTREQFYTAHSSHRPYSDWFEYLWVR